jgi:hypothetical protein
MLNKIAREMRQTYRILKEETTNTDGKAFKTASVPL